MSPLTYKDLPQSHEDCWNLLGVTSQADAVRCFLEDGASKDSNARDSLAKLVLKQSGGVPLPKIFHELPIEVRINRVLACIDRPNISKHKNECVRYWILRHHRPMVVAFLEAASVPNEDAYIPDGFNAVTVEQWSSGLAVLWTYPELPVRIYLGYVLSKTWGEERDTIWERLAKALGKGSPDVAQPVPAKQVPSAKVSTEPPKPEESSEFLLYEKEIIKALVRGALSRTEEMDAHDAEELARQVIDNASLRARPFYLLGFAQSLYGRPADLSKVKGLNAARRAWHVAGYIAGLARISGSKGVTAWIQSNPDDIAVLLDSDSEVAFAVSCHELLNCASDSDDAALYLKVASKVVSGEDAVAKVFAVTVGITLSREYSRPGKYETAYRIISAIDELLGQLENSADIQFREFASSMRFSLRRREAIIRLGEGDLEAAKDMFGKIAAESTGEDRIEARAWAAMAKAQITDFFSVFPSSDEARFRRAGEKMQSVLLEIQSTKADIATLSGTVLVCAGIADIHLGKWAEAAHFFEQASRKMVAEGRRAGSTAMLWVRFLRASCQIMALETSSPDTVVHDLEQVVESKVKPAPWFYARLLEAATLFPDSRVLGLVLANVPAEDNDSRFAALLAADMLRSDASQRAAFVRWLGVSNRRKQEIVGHLENVIRWDLEANQRSAAELALDMLETLASESDELAQRILPLLDSVGLAPDIITDGELADLKARLLFQLGRDVDASAVMVGSFRRAASSPNAWTREQSLGLLEMLEVMKVDLSGVMMLVESIRAQFASRDIDKDAIASAGPLRILYVGGNEIQRRYEPEIRREFAANYPNLSIDFEYPGWSSNWNVPAEAIRSRLTNYQGLVLSYFVRTQFGRTIRKMCNDDCPWWPAPGHGKASITRGILFAARHAASRRASS